MNAEPRILPDLTAPNYYAPPSMKRGRKARFTVDQVLDCHERGLTIEETMDELGCSRATVDKLRRQAGIRVRAKRGERVSRHAPHDVLKKPATMPAIDNPALSEARSIYPSTVTPVDGLQHLLIEGKNSRKIGDRVKKGRWAGFPIYTLTLEERATCPTSCRHWRSCYANAMPFAKRIVHGPDLEERLEHELALLQSRYPGGFAVRLHVLGDFYSVAYVDRWKGWLGRFPALHVFGFSARWNREDPIAVALIRLVMDRWDRFAIRFSDAPSDECSTVSLEHPIQKPDDAVICPQQLGKTLTCSSCALCWQTKKRVAFLHH